MLAWIVSVLLIIIGAYVSVMNWGVFVNNHILKKPWASAVPFVGGVSAGLGLALLPIPDVWKLFWVPLILDWGSLPVVFAAILESRKRRS